MVSSDDSSRGVLVSTRSRPEDQNPRPELDRPSEPTDASQLWLPRIFGNPAPLGLCAFALTCFTSSAITVCATETVKLPDAVTASAFAYGGFVQILVGMWYASCIMIYGYSLTMVQGIGPWEHLQRYILLLLRSLLDYIRDYIVSGENRGLDGSRTPPVR